MASIDEKISLLGKLCPRYTQQEQFLLMCYYDKCKIYEVLWTKSAKIFDTTYTIYMIIVALINAIMSIITPYYSNNDTVKIANSTVNALTAMSITLTKTDTFNYLGLVKDCTAVANQYRELANTINADLIASDSPDSYAELITKYNYMSSEDFKISWLAKYYCTKLYGANDQRCLPTILGGVGIVLPSLQSGNTGLIFDRPFVENDAQEDNAQDNVDNVNE